MIPVSGHNGLLHQVDATNLSPGGVQQAPPPQSAGGGTPPGGMLGAGTGGGAHNHHHHHPLERQASAPPVVREQDRFMPIANVIRIMRKVLPTHAKISDDAKETIQECVSEYISFITSEANERCQQEQRKTITAEDVLWAMSKLGFDDYIEPLTLYLHRYREVEGDHRGSIRGENLPPIKRSASADLAAAGAHHHHHHMYGPPSPYGHAPPPFNHHGHHPHYHPHHAAMFAGGGMMGGAAAAGFYRSADGGASGGAGPSQGPPPVPLPASLSAHAMPSFDPYHNGNGPFK